MYIYIDVCIHIHAGGQIIITTLKLQILGAQPHFNYYTLYNTAQMQGKCIIIMCLLL